MIPQLSATNIPLSLYIHLPWCLSKCPYCDFNSHPLKQPVPEQQYINALLQDLSNDLPLVSDRMLHTIFIGGGTPSLFSVSAITHLIQEIKQRIACAPHMEITLEANPGTVEQSKFQGYRQAGINRLSLGVQSFDPEQLRALGRVHNEKEAHRAIEIAQANFTNVNIDLMFGLPQQSLAAALADLQAAIAHQPQHISWYQLTLEPNTAFHRHPPALPEDDLCADMHLVGTEQLHQAGYFNYEISAYAKPNLHCLHNVNYWQFGDYLGIGAGAHSKITDFTQAGGIHRMQKIKHPKHYLQDTSNFIAGKTTVATEEIAFEFMINVLRLKAPIPLQLWHTRTGLSNDSLLLLLEKPIADGMMELDDTHFKLTDRGHRYYNNSVMYFL